MLEEELEEPLSRHRNYRHRYPRQRHSNDVRQDESLVRHPQHVCADSARIASAAGKRDGYEECNAYRSPALDIGVNLSLCAFDKLCPKFPDDRNPFQEFHDVIDDGVEQRAQYDVGKDADCEYQPPVETHSFNRKTEGQVNRAGEYAVRNRRAQLKRGNQRNAEEYEYVFEHERECNGLYRRSQQVALPTLLVPCPSCFTSPMLLVLCNSMKDKTKTWLEMATNDLEFARSILANKNRPYYAAHFCHQSLEKILKAVVQERTDEMPKRTHNFKVLWEQGSVPLTEEQKLQLLDIMPHYLGTRYPEDVQALHKTYTVEFVSNLFKETEELFQWLKEYLTSKQS